MIFLLILACTGSFNGVKITGKVKNSNHEYLYLAHQPLFRGNYNSDGFKSVGDKIDDKGNFDLISENLIDAADYWIQIKDKAFQLVLFKGDNLKLDIDLKNIDSSLFIQGKGAGKINVLRLTQFESNLHYDTIYTLNAYKSLLDSCIVAQLTFLDLIYNKDIKSERIQNAKNKQNIINIIKKTPLSNKEYEFLKRKISIQDIYSLGDFPYFLSQHGKIDTLKIDFSNPYFSCYNPSRYRELTNINDWQFEGCINTILKIEYLKYLQSANNNLTYKNFEINDYSKYQGWSINYAKDNFDSETFDTYFANSILWSLSMGDYEKKTYERFVKLYTNKKYLTTINRYVDLLNNGLTNTAYDLNNDKCTLDSTKFDSLINSYNGKDLYLIIWSAQFAGSKIISELPSILDFAKENRGKIETVYICIDDSKFKNLWATRIIDNSWHGQHYFLPAENNENIAKRFAAQNISGFCYGGATYTFIDKRGQITNSVESPVLLTNDKIDRYVNNTVR